MGLVVGLLGIEGLMSPGSGFLGRGTGIGNCGSAGGVVGVVKPGEVIL